MLSLRLPRLRAPFAGLAGYSLTKSALLGLTRLLLNKTRAANDQLSLPVLVESSYHSQNVSSLKHCTSLLAIAGGVGITGILPLAQSFPGPVARLYWGVKHDDIVQGVAPELARVAGFGNWTSRSVPLQQHLCS